MASVTITTTAPQDARLTVAFGALLHPGNNATTAEVKAHLIEYMRRVVQDYERNVAIAAVAAPASFDPT